MPPREPAPDQPDQFRRLVAIMERLLAPDGCPWDREQSHKTLRTYAIEEAYEVCESIDLGDMTHLKEELGDLGLQIVFHAALARREGHFDIDDVYRSICEKLVRRHPHVFGELDAKDSATVLKNWEAIKREEREEKSGKPPSALEGVPRSLPGLQRAQRLQVKAARVGFDWPNVGPVFDKIREEIDELEAEYKTADPDRIEAELGDLLFALTNLARFLKVDAEQAITGTSARFIQRFQHIEKRALEQGRRLPEMTLEEMDAFWDEAKKLEKGT